MTKKTELDIFLDCLEKSKINLAGISDGTYRAEFWKDGSYISFDYSVKNHEVITMKRL